jgi:hypothetical protein
MSDPISRRLFSAMASGTVLGSVTDPAMADDKAKGELTRGAPTGSPSISVPRLAVRRPSRSSLISNRSKSSSSSQTRFSRRRPPRRRSPQSD